MIPQISGVATGAAEETAPVKEQSLSEEILSLMRGEEPPATVTTEEVPEEVTKPEVTEIPAETEEPPEEEPAAAEGHWPPSASKRVAEETAKRKKHQSRADQAESERNHWMGVAQDLKVKLEEASLPKPTRDDPLADVFDQAGLNTAKSNYLQIKEAATRALDENPTDTEIDVQVGKNDKGEPILQTFTRKQLSDMRLNAENALSNLIPERQAILVEREKYDVEAVRIFPQFAENDGNNAWAGFVRQTLHDHPTLRKVPKIAIWLGATLVGAQVTDERLKKQPDRNGQSSEAREILAASSQKFKSAPAVSTGRVASQTTPRRGADVEAARKAMKARPGSDEAMADFIDAKLFRSPSRGYTKVS